MSVSSESCDLIIVVDFRLKFNSEIALKTGFKSSDLMNSISFVDFATEVV